MKLFDILYPLTGYERDAILSLCRAVLTWQICSHSIIIWQYAWIHSPFRSKVAEI